MLCDIIILRKSLCENVSQNFFIRTQPAGAEGGNELWIPVRRNNGIVSQKNGGF